MLRLKLQQIDFSTVLFDTLFGLILFFSIDSFLEIQDALHFSFYLFSIIILIHWWLIFKSCDDAFAEEVTDSGLDLIVGIVQLVLIDYIVLLSRSFEYLDATLFLIALLCVDVLWTLIWRYVGRWKTKRLKKINYMESELDNNLKTLLITIALFFILAATYFLLAPLYFIVLFILFYLLFVFLTFKLKIVDINFF